MSLEILPDELLLIICSYLNAYDVLQAFNDLNSRLNNTISDYRTKINLTRMTMTYLQFNQYCHMLLRPSLGLQIRSLVLSNDRNSIDQITLFTQRVWPLHEKLPNLERLVFYDIDYNQLDLLVPKIVCFERLKELTIIKKIDFSKSESIVRLFHILTTNFDSLQCLSLSTTFGISQMSTFNLNNNTITHLTLSIDRTNDLIIVMHAFHALQFFNVTIQEFEMPDENRCFDRIIMTKLNEFHIKTEETDLLTFDGLKCLLMNIQNLQRIKCEINLGRITENENVIDYLNGQKWHQIRTQLHHLQDFEFLIKYGMISGDHEDTKCLQMVKSFSEFSDWSVDIGQINYLASTYVHVSPYTKKRRLFDTSTKKQRSSKAYINLKLLNELNEQEMRTLIDGASCLDIDICDDDDDDEVSTEFPPLVLLDSNFPKLHKVTVGAADYVRFNKRWESFLKELFHRSPNLYSIIIHSSGDGTGYDDILDILSCFEDPSMSVKECIFSVKSHYDQFLMEKVVFHLPMLTSLAINGIYNARDMIIIVNTCVSHLKHLFYLEMDNIRFRNQIDEEIFSTADSIESWLKTNTLLGDPVIGRPFYAICTYELKIWL